jgi:hypothetical protein
MRDDAARLYVFLSFANGGELPFLILDVDLESVGR